MNKKNNEKSLFKDIESYEYISIGKMITLKNRSVYPIYKISIITIKKEIISTISIDPIAYLFIESINNKKEFYIQFFNIKYKVYENEILEKIKKNVEY